LLVDELRIVGDHFELDRHIRRELGAARPMTSLRLGP